MKPSNFNFEKELLQGPLAQKGFTDELRRKIEKKVDQQSKLSKPWIQFASALCFGIFLIVGGFIYQGSTLSPDIIPSEPDHQAVANIVPPVKSPSEISTYPISGHSGLLLGLRSEDAATGESAYRTIYIAQDHDQVNEIAEGDGILVPYKQKFWEIDAFTQETANGKYQYLMSYPADQEPQIKPLTQYANEKINHSEKLMFVGNQYVSIAETEQNADGENSTNNSSVWVTQIPLLHMDRLGEKGEPAHISLANIMNDESASDSWTLVREDGHWVPKLANIIHSDNSQRYILQALSESLPESVINYDTLCCTWQEIAAKQPKAVDALSSPDNHMVAIFAEDHIWVYSRQSEIANEPALTIKLQKGESLIMAQWATDHYVDDWAQQVKQFLR